MIYQLSENKPIQQHVKITQTSHNCTEQSNPTCLQSMQRKVPDFNNNNIMLYLNKRVTKVGIFTSLSANQTTRNITEGK